MVVSNPISTFSAFNYIKLVTFRKNGQPVGTTVWFTTDGTKIYVVTRSETGKVKRLRNNPNVRIAPSGMIGKLKGKWFDGRAAFANAQDLEYALESRKKKYGLKAKLAGLFIRAKGLVGIVIYFDD